MSNSSDEDIIVQEANGNLKVNDGKAHMPLTVSGQVDVNKGSRLASIEIAEMHGSSRRIYKSKVESADENEHVQKCPCCNFPVTGTEFSLFCSHEELSELGASFPLIFKLTNYLIIGLLAVCAVACLPCLIDNIMQGEDDWTKERSFNLLTPATYGKSYTASFWQPFLHIGICGLLVFYYMWIVKMIKEKSIEYDTNNTTPSDFTLIVRGLPTGYKQEDLQNHIEKNFQGKELKVVLIIPTYKISGYMECTKLLADWRFQFQLVKNFEEKFNEPMKITKCCKTIELEDSSGCQLEITKLEQQQKSLSEEMDQKNLSSVAFVTFSSQIMAREIADEWSRTPLKRFFDRIFPCKVSPIYKFNGSYVHAEMAPPHTDINWENLGIPNRVKYSRRFITILIALITIGIAVVIMAATAVWKSRVNSDKENQSSDSIRAATIIPSIITVIINFIVARLIRVFSAYEKYTTWTDFNCSVLDRLILFILINNILIPVLIYSVLDEAWFSEGGLAYTVFWLEIMNALVSPAILLIYPKNIIKKIKQFQYRRQEKAGQLKISQKEANMAFEGPEVDLADRLANILKNFTMSLFYAPIVPIGPFIAIFGLFIEMAVFKYILVKVCSQPKVYSSDLVQKAAGWIKLSLLLYSLGILIFYSQLVPELIILEISFFVAMSVYVLTPISSFCEYCFKDKILQILKNKHSNDERYTNYFSVLPKFTSDYERENPVTKDEGTKRWEEFMDGRDPRSYCNTGDEPQNHLRVPQNNSNIYRNDPSIPQNDPNASKNSPSIYSQGHSASYNDPRVEKNISLNYSKEPQAYSATPSAKKPNPDLPPKEFQVYPPMPSAYTPNLDISPNEPKVYPDMHLAYPAYPVYPNLHPIDPYNANPAYPFSKPKYPQL